MAAPGRIPLSIDVGQYRSLPPDVRVRFDGWLEAEGLRDERIIRLRLGEGVIVAERYATDDSGHPIIDELGDELVVERVEYRVATLPPSDALGAEYGRGSSDAR